MSHTSRRTSALIGGLAAAGLSLSTLVITTAPASAVPFAGQYAKGISFSASGGGCAVSNPGSSSPVTPFGAGTTVPLDTSGTAAGTGPAPTDTASLAASSTGSMVAHEIGGTLTDFDASGTASAVVNRGPAASATCSWTATTQFQTVAMFTTNSGLLDLDLSEVGSGFAVAQLFIVKTTAPASQAVTFNIGQFTREHHLLSLSAGDYQLQLVVQATATSTTTPGQPGPATNMSFKVHGEYKPFGSAQSAAKGSGQKYLTLGDALSCASHSVTADFTNKAGKKPKHHKKPVIKKATFFVDDAAVRTVAKPNKNTLVTLSGLPDDVVTVSAQLKLTGAGKGTVTVERTYYPCT